MQRIFPLLHRSIAIDAFRVRAGSEPMFSDLHLVLCLGAMLELVFADGRANSEFVPSTEFMKTLHVFTEVLMQAGISVWPCIGVLVKLWDFSFIGLWM